MVHVPVAQTRKLCERLNLNNLCERLVRDRKNIVCSTDLLRKETLVCDILLCRNGSFLRGGHGELRPLCGTSAPALTTFLLNKTLLQGIDTNYTKNKRQEEASYFASLGLDAQLPNEAYSFSICVMMIGPLVGPLYA
jgi:hypothetical protein